MVRRHDNQSSNPVFHVPAHKNVAFPAGQLPIELVDAVSNCEVCLPEDSVDRADAYYSRQLGF